MDIGKIELVVVFLQQTAYCFSTFMHVAQFQTNKRRNGIQLCISAFMHYPTHTHHPLCANFFGQAQPSDWHRRSHICPTSCPISDDYTPFGRGIAISDIRSYPSFILLSKPTLLFTIYCWRPIRAPVSSSALGPGKDQSDPQTPK